MSCPTWCCSGRSSFLASLGRTLAAEHLDVGQIGMILKAASVVVALLLCTVAVLGRRALRARGRKGNPQDYAFFLSAGSYPGAMEENLRRLRSEFPSVDLDVLKKWVAEIQATHEEVWRLSTQGGPRILGRKVVEAGLRSKFPFLCGPGLRRAMQTCEFDAGHEGFDGRSS